MTAPATTRELRDIPLGRINPPELASRASMDEQKLDELARDIAARGVLNPLLVAVDGDRYEIIAGHRRYLASGRAGLVVVPCLVYPTKDAALEGSKYAENRFREDLNPADEAIWFAELLERHCHDDVDELCEFLHEKRGYIEGRLLLFSGDREVFTALQRGSIGIGVAQELNKIGDELHRRYLLDCAVRGGATRSVVNGWVQQWQADERMRAGQPEPAIVAAPSTPSMVADVFKCEVCGKSDNVHLIVYVPVHQHCKLAVLDRLLESFKGEG